MSFVFNTASLLVIPFLIAVLFGEKGDSRKKQLIYAVVIAAVSGLPILAFQMTLGSRVTIYECLLADAMIAAAMSVLIFPTVRNRQMNHLQMLRFICLGCMIVVVYSILTVGQTMIHGDTATASLLTKAQIAARSWFPEDWYYVNGDIWVISLQMFVAPFVMLLNDQSLARMLGSAFLVLVTAWTIYIHSKKVYEDDSWLLAIPLLFVFLAGQLDMMLYQVAYTLQMVFLIIGTVWSFRIYMHSRKKQDYIILGIFSVLLIAGGLRDLAETILPLWLTCMVMNYLEIRKQERQDWKQIWKEWIRLTIAIMVPAVIGLAVHIYLKRNLHVINSIHNALVLVASLDACLDNVFRYVTNLFECFGFRGNVQLVSLDGIWSMCSVVMCGIVVFLVPVLQALKLKQENRYVQFFYAFSVIHNLIMFVLAVFLVGKNESRYLLTSIFSWVLVSARYIYVYWISQKHFEKYIWTALFVVATVLGCLSLGVTSNGWESGLAEAKNLPMQLVERGLTKGYGDFWTVCGYEVYSDFNLRFGPLEMYDEDFIVHYWLIDGEVFEPEDTNTFLLLSEEENQRYADLLPEKFEAPVDYFEIDGVHIYVYDYDIVEDMI